MNCVKLSWAMARQYEPAPASEDLNAPLVRLAYVTGFDRMAEIAEEQLRKTLETHGCQWDEVEDIIHQWSRRIDALNGDEDNIPQGLEVCHICDNPCCINPEHLFVGTRQDNIDDRERKGRNVVKVGEENAMSKLTRKDVENARRERVLKGTTFQALANKYGVCKHTMMNAIKGITWKCVSYMPEPTPPMKIRGNQRKISPNHQQVIGTADHIKIALDVIDKKGGEQ